MVVHHLPMSAVPRSDGTIPPTFPTLSQSPFPPNPTFAGSHQHHVAICYPQLAVNFSPHAPLQFTLRLQLDARTLP